MKYSYVAYQALCFGILFYIAPCTSDDNAALAIDKFASSAARKVSAEQKPITVDDMISLRDLGGMAGEGLAVSPDGKYVAFQMHRANIEHNNYEVAWYVLSLIKQVKPISLGDAGNPQLFKSKTGGRINGAWRSTNPVWSPDSSWIAYRLMEDDSVQVWRSSLDGTVREQLTYSDANVDAFHWSDDGTQILFETDASTEEKTEFLASKTEAGIWAGDDYFYPNTQNYLLRRYQLTGGRPRLWLLEVDSKTERSATDDEVMRYFETSIVSPNEIGAVRRTNRMPGRPLSTGVTLSNNGNHFAWLEAKTEAVYPVMQVRARLNSSEAPDLSCEFRKCFGQIVELWWVRGSREVIFIRKEGANFGRQVIYGWDVFNNSVRKIYEDATRNLAGCSSAGNGLICFADTPDHPRVIVSVSFTDGLVTELFDPNLQFDQISVGETERIEWKNEFGLSTWGYVIKPLGFESGTRYPLVIIQYRARTCFKGGVGDEYPAHLFAAVGFVVLCFDEPALWDLFETRTLLEEPHLVWQDYYEKRVILDSLKAAINFLDGKGLIDPEKVGITGLSSGADTIAFALSNTEGFDAAVTSGDSWEPTSYHQMPGWVREFNRNRGFGRPGSSDDKYWAGMSIGEKAERVNTPLLILSSDYEATYSMFDYVTLRELEKPVDMYVFADEYHVKWHPRNRRAVAVRAVDWMRFWLKGEEDSDPAKAEQYARWRNLRDRHCASEVFDSQPPYCAHLRAN